MSRTEVFMARTYNSIRLADEDVSEKIIELQKCKGPPTID
jgi:hypothetical protein